MALARFDRFSGLGGLLSEHPNFCAYLPNSVGLDIMRCAECEAFISEYKYAVEQYKALCKRFGELPETAALDPKLTGQITDARLDCERYRAALEVHRESHAVSGSPA